jgi:GTP cyclohydrolase II
MKRLILSLTLLLTSAAFADVDYGFVCFGPSKDNCSVLVEKDKDTGEYFPTAKGACRLLGHSGVASTAAQNGIEGPYVILDSEGKVIKSFSKSDDYVYRFRVITRLVCKN